MIFGIDIRDIIKVLFRLKMKIFHTVHVSLAGILGTVVLASALAFAQGPNPSAIASADPNLTASQIVTEMQGHNLARAAALKHFHSVRHYSVEYKGYAAKIAAQMEVDADYDAGTGKTFRIVSQSGSKLLIDKVLKRLLESETDAQKQHASDLNAANYSFLLTGVEKVAGRPAYVLEVEPLTDNKYLYRGKIWVDAADFALARIEAAPAKNPSFWISSTAIHHKYTKTGDFWLPANNESDTEVRVGGKAVLTIDYGTYEVAPAAALVAGGN
jgi:MucB/RseB N-terminal domain